MSCGRVDAVGVTALRVDVPDFERPRDLAVVEDTDDSTGTQRVYVTALPDGPLSILEGTSALIWRAAQEHDELVASVAQLARANPESIRADVEQFVETLVAQGFLERRNG
jgi:hypothetical protein